MSGRIRITGGKGFGMSFDNGWAVSVQFGYGNYADNYDGYWRSSSRKTADEVMVEAACLTSNPAGGTYCASQRGAGGV